MLALVAMAARPALIFAYPGHPTAASVKYVEEILPPNLHSMSGLCLGFACNAHQMQHAILGLVLQAMRDSALGVSVQKCCTLIGCFVPSQDYTPLLMVQLESAADPAAEGACLAVWAAFTVGAGDPNCLPLGCLSVLTCPCLQENTMLLCPCKAAHTVMKHASCSDEAHLIQ